MTNHRIPWAFPLLSGVLLGCTPPQFVARFARDDDQIARAYIALVQRASIDSARWQLIDELARQPTVQVALQEIADSLRGIAVDSLKVAGATMSRVSGTKMTEFFYETPRAPRWLLIRIIVVGGRIGALNLVTDAPELHHLHALRLTERPIWLIPFLLAPFAGILLSVGAAIYVWRRATRRRILLTILALVGITRVTLNWSTGVFDWQVLHLSFGGQVSRPHAFAPFIIGFTLPLGAALALWLVHRMRKASVAG